MVLESVTGQESSRRQVRILQPMMALAPEPTLCRTQGCTCHATAKGQGKTSAVRWQRLELRLEQELVLGLQQAPPGQKSRFGRLDLVEERALGDRAAGLPSEP